MADSESSRGAFEQLFSAEIASRLDNTEDLLSPRTADVDFVYVLVRKTKLEDLRSVNTQIADLVIAHAVVKHLDGHLTSVAFGIPNAAPDALDQRRTFVDDLAEQLSDCVSVIHGRRTCLVGNVGSDRLFNSGYCFDDYHECLRMLIDLNPGECREV